MAEVPRESPVPSIVRQGNLKDAGSQGQHFNYHWVLLSLCQGRPSQN
jgi:hypothetical protein